MNDIDWPWFNVSTNTVYPRLYGQRFYRS